MAARKDTVTVVLKKSTLAPGAKNVDLKSLREILEKAQSKQRTLTAQRNERSQGMILLKKDDKGRKIISIKHEPVSPSKPTQAENDNVIEPLVEPRKIKREEPGYSCCFCVFHTENADEYRKHISRHISNKELRCNLCSFVTDKITDYNAHVKAVHKTAPTISTTYVCGVCEFKAFTPDGLWKHKINTGHNKLRDKNSPIACKLCGHIETDVFKLAKHISAHVRTTVDCDCCDSLKGNQYHSEGCPEVVSPLAHQYEETALVPNDVEPTKPYQCTLCEFSSEELLFLIEHIKAHARGRKDNSLEELESPFSCTLCEYRCVRPSKLVLHMKTHGSALILRCRECPFESNDLNVFRAHWKRHTDKIGQKCFVCLQHFPSPKLLAEHMLTHSRKQTMACNICHYKCLTKNRLYLHMKSHSTQKKTQVFFPCPMCKNKYSTSAALRDHLKNHSSSDKPYKCDFCDYGCYTNELLKIHMEKHGGYKYRCEICFVSFSTEMKLREHVLDHVTYDKPLNCDLCHTSFASKALLAKHMSVHSTKHLFVCHVCRTGFDDAASKRDHLARDHMFTEEQLKNVPEVEILEEIDETITVPGGEGYFEETVRASESEDDPVEG